MPLCFENGHSFVLEGCEAKVAGSEVGEVGRRGLKEALMGHDEELELDSTCSGKTFKGF